jgi:hypothetical protein
MEKMTTNYVTKDTNAVFVVCFIVNTRNVLGEVEKSANFYVSTEGDLIEIRNVCLSHTKPKLYRYTKQFYFVLVLVSKVQWKLINRRVDLSPMVTPYAVVV